MQYIVLVYTENNNILSEIHSIHGIYIDRHILIHRVADVYVYRSLQKKNSGISVYSSFSFLGATKEYILLGAIARLINMAKFSN